MHSKAGTRGHSLPQVSFRISILTPPAAFIHLCSFKGGPRTQAVKFLSMFTAQVPPETLPDESSAFSPIWTLNISARHALLPAVLRHWAVCMQCLTFRPHSEGLESRGGVESHVWFYLPNASHTALKLADAEKRSMN